MAKAKADPAAEAVQSIEIEAVEPIRHDGEDVAPGARLTLPAEQAAELIAAGAAQAVAE
jgi:hypothetical protein